MGGVLFCLRHQTAHSADLLLQMHNFGLSNFAKFSKKIDAWHWTCMDNNMMTEARPQMWAHMGLVEWDC